MTDDHPGPLPLPPVSEPYFLPFFYGAWHNLGLDFATDPGPAVELLAEHHPALRVAEFDGRACVSLNYQLYFAQFPEGFGVTQEVELNVIAYPTAAAGRLPRVGYEEYARGFDQTGLRGIARLKVLCDNPVAIDAGRTLYAEPKEAAWFAATMPSLNGPPADVWSVTCGAAELSGDGRTIAGRGGELFRLHADLTGLAREPVAATPVTGYGTEPDGRLLAGALLVHHPYQRYALEGAPRPEAGGEPDRVRLTVEDPSSAVGRLLTELIGDAPVAGVWTCQSPPVAANHRPYYLPDRG
ncbi:hypothetical protein LRS74_17110 [Streptomyces sp. LX-29]|uniref:hypothetical protein n=1 Tax=Streptomyces sp. LX-29 TaxID=2900152 RepID=UPI00240E2F3E|nr:hypothetical protein [Streptomyces sp. LX-29]WFB08574.1 hypothetical protein LRS74_17110 [Streptomyces sp. LX-29]